MKKIKQSFSLRLSLKITGILSVAMILLTSIFINMVTVFFAKEEADELKRNADQIYEVLISQQNNYEPPYGFSWSVFNPQTKESVYGNDPFIPYLEDTEGKIKKYYEKNFFLDGDLNLRYFSKDYTYLNEKWTIITAIIRDDSFLYGFLSVIPETLLLILIPLIFICFVISLLITRRTIKPVVKITESAKEISYTNLDKRLPLTGREDEIDQLSQTFNNLFSKLEADFARERQFSSDVSHELKTPLAVISGQASLLLRWGKKDPEQLEKSLGAIKNETKSMQTIIDNLLQISRYESGSLKPEIEVIHIKELFFRLKSEFASLVPNVKINIADISDNLKCKSDVELLHQILTILISNSVKFCDKDCQINLNAYKKEGKLYITEEDNGPGFTDEMLPHIYERFYRGDEAHSRKAGGFGLGLSIAKTLISSLQGYIYAENSKNHGAFFTIIL
ncbi:MAG: HAMP domain-containing histidine kinase [Treponema sp.]|nr:HAMP domain-containing histidine kinase [Treponema sp.]